MEQAEMKPAGREFTPPREIGEEELGNLISAFGNHEAKAITLIAMQQGRIYTQRDLRARVIDIQDGNIGWRIDRNLPFGYCKSSLYPIGLVAREVVDPNLSVYGYEVTPYGIEIGTALAGHLLNFSLDHDRSLIQFFGPTTSSHAKLRDITHGEETIEFRKRSPMTRLKIFWELLTASLPIREIDLVNAIGENQRLVSSHLKNLNRFGVINYQSVGVDKPKLETGFTKNTQSRINLTEEQQIVLYELLEIIDRFKNRDKAFLEEGRRKAQEILTDPEKIGKLMLKAKTTSPNSMQTPRAELEGQLFELLSRYPKSNVTQLQQYLREEFGKELGINSIHEILSAGDKFTHQVRHQANYWIVKTD